ncbi:hypothetical protein ACLOJK_016140 [Asimina triloba]
MTPIHGCHGAFKNKHNVAAADPIESGTPHLPDFLVGPLQTPATPSWKPAVLFAFISFSCYRRLLDLHVSNTPRIHKDAKAARFTSKFDPYLFFDHLFDIVLQSQGSSFFKKEEAKNPQMGVADSWEYFSGLLSAHKKKKRKQVQTVELKVRMDCDGCELKIKKALSSMKGVQSVDIDRKQNKVSVTGYVTANKVMKKVQSTGKKAEPWPYVPYKVVANAFTIEAWDKKAPPGYVRNVEALSVSNPGAKEEDKYINMFSDENPNACSIM